MSRELQRQRECSIPVSPWEVRAVIAGRKTQVRLPAQTIRKVRLRRATEPGAFVAGPSPWYSLQTGDEIRVRESMSWDRPNRRFVYCADGTEVPSIAAPPSGTTAAMLRSISVRHQASRLTLIVTEVRLQLLQQTTEDEAVAEGIVRMSCGRFCKEGGDRPVFTSAVGAFRHQWKATHTRVGERWEDNPTVVVVDFEPAILGPSGAMSLTNRDHQPLDETHCL